MNNLAIKQQILDKIESYARIIISRHKRPDGDAIGSTMGLWHVLKATYPEKEIYLQNEDTSEYLAFLGEEDATINPSLYEDALVIILDTGNRERISNQLFCNGKELIKIDHHIDREPYGDISWVEDYRSSSCEMVVDFCMTFSDKLKMTKEAATCLYTGMVTDSGRFRFSSVSGDTMRCAGYLLDFGIDTDILFAHLNLKDFDFLKFQAYAFKKMKITPGGVAYLHITMPMQKKFHLSSEQASNAVSFLDSILGSIIWIAFIDGSDGLTRVRLRSRFVTINHIAEAYHGGGHAHACGATVHNKKELKALLAEADKCITTYKSANEGWL